jgi:hypothetical protein
MFILFLPHFLNSQIWLNQLMDEKLGEGEKLELNALNLPQLEVPNLIMFFKSL